MRFHFHVYLFALTLAITTTNAAFRVPRPPKDPTPEIPSIPRPITPVTPPGRFPDPQSEPALQAQMQSNLERVEQKLEIIGIGADAVQAIVEGILDQPESTGGSGFEDATTAVISTTATPTATIPTTAYKACTTLASHLRACNSATQGFYDLSPSQQADCACYTTTTTSSVSCGPSSVQVAIVTTLAVQAFDVPVKICQSYLDDADLEKAAEALSGIRDGKAVLGAGFCSSVYVNAQSGNGTGMTEVKGLEGINDCTAVNPPAAPVDSMGVRVVGLEKGILIGVPALVGLVSWAAFA